MENVNPAGVNRLGYRSDTWPVFNPLMGSIFASAFTVIVPANDNVAVMRRSVVFISGFFQED
jgi:hypothetical protein